MFKAILKGLVSFKYLVVVPESNAKSVEDINDKIDKRKDIFGIKALQVDRGEHRSRSAGTK